MLVLVVRSCWGRAVPGRCQRWVSLTCPLSVHRTVPVQGRLHRTDLLGPGAAAVPAQALQRRTGRLHRYCFGLARNSWVTSGIIWEKEHLAHVLTSLLPCCLAREISSLEHLPVHPQYVPVPSQQPWASPGPELALQGEGLCQPWGALPVPPLSQLLQELVGGDGCQVGS